jgi:hypothetical protein
MIMIQSEISELGRLLAAVPEAFASLDTAEITAPRPEG